MEKVEVTSLSSRGQVVIPQDVRDKMHLHVGEKFVVIGKEDTIVLKKLEAPSFKGFDRMLKKAHEHAKNHGLKQKDVEEAIKKTRKR